MARISLLQENAISAYFDDTVGISFVTFRDVINAEVVYKLYGWINKLLGTIDNAEVRGMVYDYRAVTRFDSSYLSIVQRENQRMTRRNEGIFHPEAFIVGTMYQEKMIRITQQLAPADTGSRTRIVDSMQDAMAYIEAWHSRNETWV